MAYMNLEDNMLSETSQSRKDKDCIIPLIRDTYSSQIHSDRVWLPGFRGTELDELLFNGYRILVLEDDKNSLDRWW